MSQDALGQLKHLKTASARWPFPDAVDPTMEEVKQVCPLEFSNLRLHLVICH